MMQPSHAGHAPTILVVDDDAGYARIGERAAAVKKEAKRRHGSVVVTERETRQ